MPRTLKVFIAGLVAVSAIALAATTYWVPIDPKIAIDQSDSNSPLSKLGGIALWIAVTLAASALPVQMPRGARVSVSIAPIIAAMSLGGPTAAGWVAAIGSTEMREVRGRVVWYGTLANHAGIVLPAIVAGFVSQVILGALPSSASGESLTALNFAATIGGAIAYFALNVTFTSIMVGLRTGIRPATVLAGDAQDFYRDLFALAPLAWLMAQMYLVVWWASLLFALPLYTTRVAYHRFVEMREMFTQTIGALAEAVDARDPYTSEHSRRVMTMSVDIGRVRRVSAAGLEALEWGGLLHDVGKIGVRDAVLLKPDKLTRDERAEMNAHPVMGANIIAPVTKLAPVVPLIRHHHEWFNGSGYPDRLVGTDIPELARVLAVADAFEAMTAQRPYRMTPLTPAEALAELRRYSGIQFDPQMVEAFARTKWAEGVADPGRPNDPRQVPLIREVAGRMTAAATAGSGSPEPGAVPAENT